MRDQAVMESQNTAGLELSLLLLVFLFPAVKQWF